MATNFSALLKKILCEKKYPFMFYVSLNDQGRPLPLFQLGAIDYVVYPIDTRALVERIHQAMNPAQGAHESQSRADIAPNPIQNSKSPSVSREGCSCQTDCLTRI